VRTPRRPAASTTSRIGARSRESGLDRNPPLALRDAGADTARTYGRSAGLLSVGLGVTGFLTYLFFALASHALSADDYGEIVVLWSLIFVTVVTLYRPVEQLLSRTIAERDARDQSLGRPIRVAATIQGGLAVTFAVAALALRGPLEDGLFSGEELLYWVLVATVLAFAASFFARGFLAGTRRFGFYTVLLLLEAASRVSFALAVAIGVASGQSVVALGIVVGPVVSLLAAPFAISSRRGDLRHAPTRSSEPEFTLAHGGGFAAAVLVIMFTEQVLLNAGTLLVRVAEGAAAAGFIFNVLMLVRAPLYLFQAVVTSLLPHLTRLHAGGSGEGESAFRLSVRATQRVVVAFAALVALCVIVAGPDLMQLTFGEKFSYDRLGMLIVTVGMGFYLAAVTLNQAALAQGQVRRAAACWIVCGVGFVSWIVIPVLDEFRRVELGFAGAAVVLCGLLYLLYRRPQARPEDVVRPDSPQELEARLAAADEAG
jgi:O-antigen/teichoic acid export membrane protein